MEKDIISDLLGKIQAEFNANTKRSKVIKAKIEALKNKSVTHKDSNDFAIEVGNVLKDVFKDTIKSDVLQDNKMYYDVAKGILEPSLKNNYDLVVGYAGDVQAVLNRKAGINIAKQIPKINQERIDNLVEKISEYDNFEDAKWLLDEPVVNFTQSIVDGVVKENVEFQYQSGLKPKIIRREAGSCREWCSKLAGTYDYPEGVPKDVWRRHRFCRCTVEYVPGDGRRQNVWTKKISEPQREGDIFKRKKLSEGNRNKSPKEISKILKTHNINEKEIYINAQSGKKHKGIYVDAQNKSKAKLEKSIRSHYKQVEEHSLKIRHPDLFDKNWNKKNETEKNGLLKKWSKDLKRNAEQASIEIEVWRNKFDG